jgi:hypothetical protein
LKDELRALFQTQACKGILLYSVFVVRSLASSKPQRRDKKMRRFVLAVALACALSGTALAGIIPTTDYVPPPPPPPENMQTTSMGIIPTSDYAPPTEDGNLLSVLLMIMSVI